MTPIFANAATIDISERLVLKGGAWRPVRLRVRYGILPLKGGGLALIDTGYGPPIGHRPAASMALRLYHRAIGADLSSGDRPDRALARMGAAIADVRLVILTHFHADHIGDLQLFPDARIVCRGSVFTRIQRRNRLANLRHGIFTELLPESLTDRLIDLDSLPTRPLGLPFGRGIDLLGDGSLLAIDLPGHAEGHIGVLFTTLPVPFLYAADASWLSGAIPDRMPGFPASLVGDDLGAISQSAEAIAAFARTGGDILFCHEPGRHRLDQAETR